MTWELRTKTLAKLSSQSVTALSRLVTQLCQRTAARYIDQQPPQAAGYPELFGQSGLSGLTLCQCHRVTSATPLVSSQAKHQLQVSHYYLQDQLNQDSGLPVWCLTSFTSKCRLIDWAQCLGLVVWYSSIFIRKYSSNKPFHMSRNKIQWQAGSFSLKIAAPASHVKSSPWGQKVWFLT